MPWTKTNYPVSLKNLPARVRNKAIEIANALLEEGNMEEGIAIATATSRAKDWATNRGLSVKPLSADSKSKDPKKHGEDIHVIPRENGWMVKSEKATKGRIYNTKAAALKKAEARAEAANSSVTLKSKTGKIASRKSFNPNNPSKN